VALALSAKAEWSTHALAPAHTYAGAAGGREGAALGGESVSHRSNIHIYIYLYDGAFSAGARVSMTTAAAAGPFAGTEAIGKFNPSGVCIHI